MITIFDRGGEGKVWETSNIAQNGYRDWWKLVDKRDAKRDGNITNTAMNTFCEIVFASVPISRILASGFLSYLQHIDEVQKKFYPPTPQFDLNKTPEIAPAKPTHLTPEKELEMIENAPVVRPREVFIGRPPEALQVEKETSNMMIPILFAGAIIFLLSR